MNRSPVTGRIIHIAYKAGKFLNADLDKASEENERNGFVIETPGGTFGVVQIAGLVARRIVFWAREGEPIAVGDRLGLIRFGSRVDVYLPDGVRPLVGVGQRTIAGETILADANGNHAAADASRWLNGPPPLDCRDGNVVPALRAGIAARARPAFSRHPASMRIDPQSDHAAGPLRRHDGDPPGDRRTARARRRLHRRRRLSRRIDGRLRAYLEGTSRFGAELDSLADFVNFGVVPALVLYFWGLHDLHARLDRRAGLRHVPGAAPRPLQRHADGPEQAGLAGEFLRRHAGARRRTVLLPIYLHFGAAMTRRPLIRAAAEHLRPGSRS